MKEDMAFKILFHLDLTAFFWAPFLILSDFDTVGHMQLMPDASVQLHLRMGNWRIIPLDLWGEIA